jgi:serine/threonine protein phosphatase PrpC
MVNVSNRKLRVASITDQGLVRKENQDAFFSNQEKRLFVVADGMGGHAAGATAAKIVVETLPSLVLKGYRQLAQNGRPISDVEIGQALRKAAIKLNNKVNEEGRENLEMRGMGATVVLASFIEKWVFFMHLGDSRAYLLRRNHFQQLTEDHTIGNMLLKMNNITAEEFDSKPALHRLSRCVGMDGEAKPEVQKMVVQPGDRLLLCSDGLSKMVPDERLAEILGGVDDPDVICRQFIAAAKAAGGQDNITAIAIFVDQ